MGNVEISNGARVSTYVTNVGVPEATMGLDCQCEALDEGYSVPYGEAPWYEPSRPESADFLGFYASNMVLQPVASRNVAQAGSVGSVLGPLRAKGRVLQVSGLMMATSAEGMAYGERWLQEALRGSPCDGGGCPTDSATILPACPEDPTYDSARYFRSLVNVGLVDGPVYLQLQDLPECKLQQASFIIASSMPYLYHPATRCLDNTPLVGMLSCALTTPEWMGEGTFVIDITNDGVTDVEDIVITGRISLDGSCPVSGLGTSVPPSFVYTIPVLGPEDRIVIDGASRQALYYDASCKSASSALPYVTFEGAWKWPDVESCTTMCLTIESDSGSAVVTTDTYLREW